MHNAASLLMLLSTNVITVKTSFFSLCYILFPAANKESLAVAHCTGAQFIRVEGFVYSHIADEGWIDSSAGDILRYKRYIGADNTLIFTDIKKKHRL